MIPKIIHHIWFGDTIPLHLVHYRQTIVDMHPDWEHRLWTDNDFGWLVNQEWFDRASEISPGHEGQLKSDIARYEILSIHGGVYVDFDMEALQPLDPLLEHRAFAGWELEGRWVNNAVLGAEPEHPLMDELVRAIPRSCIEAEGVPGRRPNKITGPHLLTPICRAHDITLLPQHTFYPYNWDELDRGGDEFPDSILAHHWDNARKRHGVPRG